MIELRNTTRIPLTVQDGQGDSVTIPPLSNSGPLEDRFAWNLPRGVKYADGSAIPVKQNATPPAPSENE